MNQRFVVASPFPFLWRSAPATAEGQGQRRRIIRAMWEWRPEEHRLSPHSTFIPASVFSHFPHWAFTLMRLLSPAGGFFSVPNFSEKYLGLELADT